MTSSADLFLGVSSAALNQWIETLFGMASLQQSLFTGTVTQQCAALGGSATVSWAVKAPPTVTLADPGPLWKSAVGAGGTPPSPVANAFSVELSAVDLSLSALGQPAATATIPVTALMEATVAGSMLSLMPLGVVVDLSQASSNEKIVFQYIVIPKLMQLVHAALGGYAIPQLAPLGVTLSPPAIAISNGVLLAAFNLSGNSPMTPELDQPPGDPVFLLASPAAVQVFVQAGVLQIANTSKSASGSASFGIGSAGYNAGVGLGSVTVQADPADLSRVTATVNVSAWASAQATVIFSIGIGYEASVTPSPISLSIELVTTGNNVLAKVGAIQPLLIDLVPTGDLAQEILSGIALPLATTIATVLQPLAEVLLEANSPYTVFTIQPITQTICGASVTVDVYVTDVKMLGNMLKVSCSLQVESGDTSGSA